jgi:uncharacterized protein DUF5818
MKKLVLLSSVLLLSVTWVIAQQYPSQSSGKSSSQTSSAQSGKQSKIQGCLSGSEGNYTLTDKSGNTYQLTGDTTKLKDHVGHEVQVIGNVSGSSSGAASSKTSATGGASIDVSSIKHISETCSSR